MYPDSSKLPLGLIIASRALGVVQNLENISVIKSGVKCWVQIVLIGRLLDGIEQSQGPVLLPKRHPHPCHPVPSPRWTVVK